MKNLILSTEYALLDKKLVNGLSAYTQSNCQVTMTNNGFRIYRPPNLTVAANGNTMWGGLKIDNSNNRFGLIKGHTYIILFDVAGKTTNAPTSKGWTSWMGWSGAGLQPTPSNVSSDWVSSNFNGAKTCWYKWTLSDDLYKVCTETRSDNYFIKGNTYLSYNHFQFGFGYESTGTLGTDLYITNLRMYDITNNPKFNVEKSGIILGGLLKEKSSQFNINQASEINANIFYEL